MPLWTPRRKRDAQRIAALEAQLGNVQKAQSQAYYPNTTAGTMAAMASEAQRRHRGEQGGPAIIPEPMQEGLHLAGMDGNPAFGPGTPIAPYIGYDERPRRFDYPPGWNITARPRTQEGRISFDTLQQIINTYDVAQICIGHIIDDIRSMDWTIQPISGLEGDVAEEIRQARKFFQHPDGVTGFDSWQSMLLEDMLRYDASAIYKRRDKAGRLIALEVVDGTTIVPLIDEHGRPPGGHEADRLTSDEGLPPAFLQYIKGVPWDWLTFDELLYPVFRPQTNSPYGLPPMEWLLLNANTDIRFQWYFLQYFTEGSMPDAFGELPPDLSNPEEVEQWQNYWDAVMEGDAAQKHKIRWVPADTKINPIKKEGFDEKFPLYLMRKTCAAFHVTPSDLGFTDAVNKASADTQMDVQFRIGTMPRVRYLQGLYDWVLQEELGYPLVFRFDTGQEKEDRLQEAQAWDFWIKMGAASPDEPRRKILGLPVDPEHPVPRFVYGTRTGPVPLSAVYDAAGKVEPETAAPDGATINAYLSSLPTTPGEAVNPNTAELGNNQATANMGAGAPPGQSGPNTARFQAIPGVLQEHQPQQAVTPRPAAQAPTKKPVQKAGPTVGGLVVRAADTGRVLMTQRSDKDETDPAAGKWEFPGGHLEDGDKDPYDGALREFREETGTAVPAKGRFVDEWTSPDGKYMGHIVEVPTEDDLNINKEHDNRALNPDDPDGDDIEVAAWWEPTEVVNNPAVRSEVHNAPWGKIHKDDIIRQELRKWRDNSRNRVKKGLVPRQFESEIIPQGTITHVWYGRHLHDAHTREEVDAAFDDYLG